MKVFKRVVSALTTAALFTLAILYVPQVCFWPVVGVLFLLASYEYLHLVRLRAPLGTVRGLLLGLVGVVILAFALGLFPCIASRFGSPILLYVIACVKVSDMGGFALGKAIGKHKMCPTISPKKSWEGLLGSILAAAILSCLFMPLTHFGWMKAIAFGTVAALVGTFGDLVESKVKRWAGVKDSGTFMPAELGGFLDMLDSLLFAPTVLTFLFLVG